MKKISMFIMVVLFCVKNIYADIPFIIEIHNVTVNGGNVIIEIFYNENSYNNRSPDRIFTVLPNNTILLYEVALNEGEYVIAARQDTNGNGVMDYGLFGIPKETYGFSNLKGKIPGNFNQHKFRANDSNKRIIVPLIKF
jgi:uncharacterized protein (DUF2141 family)